MKSVSHKGPMTLEPVVLKPSEDPYSGQVVYAVSEVAVPFEDATGRIPPRAATDLVLTQDGDIAATADDTGEVQPVSRIPRGRMAAASWDEIAQALRNAEEGKSRGADVELHPGGELVLVFSEYGREAQPVSRLPQERMAAVNTGPSAEDVAILRRLDPGNTESWSPMQTGLIAGWTFRMTPPVPGQGQFVFLAFRSPSDGNAFRISVLHPDMDAEFGHLPHMIRTYVGGQRIPVICGPDGRPAADLAEVRTHAAKWMAYTSARMAGLNPRFSR